MTFFLKAVKAFGLAGSPASLSFWAGSVLAVAGFCGLFAVARRSASGVIRMILEKLTLQPGVTELPSLPMEISFDSVEKPLVHSSDGTLDLPRDGSHFGSTDSAEKRWSWTSRVLTMAKGAIGDRRGKDGDLIME